MEFLREEDYAGAMHEQVWPALSAVRRELRVRVDSDTTLFAVCYEHPAPRGSVVVLHGLGETAEKYRELCYYFLQSGLTVLVPEMRGHGRSSREVERGLIYIRRFSQYAEDLTQLLRAPEVSLPAPRYLFSHSMGGAIAALVLSRPDHGFTRAVLSSPMIALQYKNVPRFVGYTASGAARLLLRGKRRFPGIPAAPTPEQESFTHAVATSRARYEAHRALKCEDACLHASSVTAKWMWEALRCTHRILARGVPERIDIPVRLYAAEQESLVLSAPQREFASRVPQGEFHTVKGAKHEIYYSTDEVAHPYFAEILAFFGAEK